MTADTRADGWIGPAQITRAMEDRGLDGATDDELRYMQATINGELGRRQELARQQRVVAGVDLACAVESFVGLPPCARAIEAGGAWAAEQVVGEGGHLGITVGDVIRLHDAFVAWTEAHPGALTGVS